ncbi:MAG: energy transducer TonB [Acidobacteria bacterium]|nr:energy transducer TonB [Acidobacteriota bacterium]
MQKDIFTFIENESILTRVKREASEALVEAKKDPKKFMLDTFRGDPTASKQRRYLRVGIAGSVFFWLFAMILYVGIYFWKPIQTEQDTDQLQKIVDLTPLKAPELLPAPKATQRAGGGGGGGRREMTPPSKGKPPKASLEQPQIVAPTTKPPEIKNPSLPVLPTIQVQPELVAKNTDVNIPIGVPTGVPGPPSDGPGSGSGIGTGKGGGVGSGDGTGLGPGRGYNTGGGNPGLGGGDGIFSSNTPGIKQPQILSKQKPKYTEDARRDKIQGVVVLSVVFRKDGTIGDVKVVRGLGYGLDEEAIKAAALIKFLPGAKDGSPINVRARLEFTFTLL